MRNKMSCPVVFSLVACLICLLGCPNPISIAQFGLMSQAQIRNSFDQGIASQPYLVYSETTLEKIQQVCSVTPGIRISIEDTYRSAYGKELGKVLPGGDTGQAFRNLKDATFYLQQILKDQGRSDYEAYVMTSIDTARRKGYVLFAVVKRPPGVIPVFDKFDRKLKKQYGPTDKEYYRPYPSDSQGKALDTVVDWAGLPEDCFSSQPAQAVLLTLAANQILAGTSRQDYWESEKKWIKGGFEKVIKQQDEKTCIACGFEEGFFEG